MLANIFDLQIWYAVPLIIAISLVYGATRHEDIGPILRHSLRAAGWVSGFMFAIFVLLKVAGWGL